MLANMISNYFGLSCDCEQSFSLYRDRRAGCSVCTFDFAAVSSFDFAASAGGSTANEDGYSQIVVNRFKRNQTAGTPVPPPYRVAYGLVSSNIAHWRCSRVSVLRTTRRSGGVRSCDGTRPYASRYGVGTGVPAV